MKKFIVFLLLICTLSFIFIFKTNSNNSLENLSNEIIYYAKNIDCFSEINYIQNGDIFIIKKSNNQNIDTDFLKQNLIGVTYCFNDKHDLNSILKMLNFKQNFLIKMGEKLVLTGYSNFSTFNGKSVDGKNCNSQIVIEKNLIMVGFPFLLGSY